MKKKQRFQEFVVRYKYKLFLVSMALMLLISLYQYSQSNANFGAALTGAYSYLALDRSSCGFFEYIVKRDAEGYNESCKYIRDMPLTAKICKARQRTYTGNGEFLGYMDPFGPIYKIATVYEQVECFDALAQHTKKEKYCRQIKHAKADTVSFESKKNFRKEKRGRSISCLEKLISATSKEVKSER